MTRAINHPAGHLARFWVQSIALWRSRQSPPPSTICDEYRDALSEMMGDVEMRGTLARVQLMAGFHYLAFVDEEWVRQNLIPLLDPGQADFAPTWDGLTYCGPMAPEAAELLREPFLKSVEQVGHEMEGSLGERFISKYVQMLTWFATGATDEWITKLLGRGDSQANHEFAMEIGRILALLEEEVQQEWWERWMKDYWKNRLQGVPCCLDPTEIANMLHWTVELTGVFPEAVELATQMDPVTPSRASVLSLPEDSELPDRYPEALGRLLVHVGKDDNDPWIWSGLRNTMDRLVQHDLPDDLRQQLEETKARHGL